MNRMEFLFGWVIRYEMIVFAVTDCYNVDCILCIKKTYIFMLCKCIKPWVLGSMTLGVRGW